MELVGEAVVAMRGGLVAVAAGHVVLPLVAVLAQLAFGVVVDVPLTALGSGEVVGVLSAFGVALAVSLVEQLVAGVLLAACPGMAPWAAGSGLVAAVGAAGMANGVAAVGMMVPVVVLVIMEMLDLAVVVVALVLTGLVEGVEALDFCGQSPPPSPSQVLPSPYLSSSPLFSFSS